MPKIMEPMGGFPAERDPNLPDKYIEEEVDYDICDCEPLEWEDIQ